GPRRLRDATMAAGPSIVMPMAQAGTIDYKRELSRFEHTPDRGRFGDGQRGRSGQPVLAAHRRKPFAAKPFRGRGEVSKILRAPRRGARRPSNFGMLAKRKLFPNGGDFVPHPKPI